MSTSLLEKELSEIISTMISSEAAEVCKVKKLNHTSD